MALANRFLLRNPRLRTLTVLIRLLMLSAAPLLTFRMTAFRMPQRWFLIVWAAALTGSSRHRMAQDSHRFQPLRAQVGCRDYADCNLRAFQNHGDGRLDVGIQYAF